MTDCHPPLPQRENPHRPNIPRQKQTSNPPYPQKEPAVYEQELTQNGFVLMGNEGNGISSSLEKYISKRLYLPNYPPFRQTTESLNVAVATAIVCAEFRRRSIGK